jgi:pilus assembly protein CpaB
MRRSSIFLLLGAVLLGLLAVMAARMMMANGADQGAKAEAPKTYVIVAGKPLKFGDKLAPADLRAQPWPGTLPDAAYASVQDVVGDGERTVLRDVKEG